MIHIFEGGSIVYDPSTLTDKEKSEAVLVVNSIPEPEQIEGKIPILNVDSVLNRVFYTYEDAPLVEPEVVPVSDPTTEQVQMQILMNTELLVMYKELGL